MRQIVLDTETTGIDPSEGHRIIEIGCVEMMERQLTGRNYHVYINPEREVEAEAITIHGITNEFLADKPVFSEIADEFFEFIKGAELVIHNAAFDVGFMDSEFARLKPLRKTADHCGVVDSLAIARKKHPGQKNSLDALCKRYGVEVNCTGHCSMPRFWPMWLLTPRLPWMPEVMISVELTAYVVWRPRGSR